MRSIDPVCRTEVETEDALTFQWGERCFAFCGERCRRAFAENPVRYACIDHEVPEEALLETEAEATRWFG